MPEMQYKTSHDIKADAEGPGFSGYASHFWSVDSYRDVIAPGAFRKTLAERGDKIKLLWNHDKDVVIGKLTEIKEDKVGLRFNARVSATSMGNDVMILLRDGVPLGVSFGYWPVKTRTATDEDPLIETEYSKGVKRTDIQITTEVKLMEISPVSFPANELAPIQSVRAMAELDHLDTILNALREGTADEAMLQRAQQIVAAVEAGAVEDTPPVDTGAEDDRQAIIARRAENMRKLDSALSTFNRRGIARWS